MQNSDLREKAIEVIVKNQWQTRVKCGVALLAAVFFLGVLVGMLMPTRLQLVSVATAEAETSERKR